MMTSASEKSATLGRLAADLRTLRRFLSKSAGDRSLRKSASVLDGHAAIIDKILDGVETLREYDQIEPELLRQHQMLIDVNTGTMH